MRGPALAVLGIALSGCVFPATATGTLETHDDGLWIRASNDKSRRLVLDARSAPLAYATGLLVELDGTFRHGDIEVGTWRIVEGPHGLQAWAGRLGDDGHGRVTLEVPDNGTWGVRGPLTDVLWEARGRIVLVEGAVDGPMRIQAFDWRPLDGAPP